MRIMAIDYGDAHTGAAVSDLTGLLAGYTETIHTRRQEEVLSRLGELIGEYGVEELVLGYPKNMDGTLGPRAEKAEAMARTLEERVGLPVKLWDERRRRTAGQKAEEDGGRRGGGPDPGGVPDLAAVRGTWRIELMILSCLSHHNVYARETAFRAQILFGTFSF